MESLVAVISLSVTTLMTFGLFVWQLIVNRQQLAHDERERAIELVLESLNTVVRRLDQPAFLRPWFKPELEFALVVPKLLLRIPKRDRAVGHWTLLEIQKIQEAESDQHAAFAGIAMSAALTDWHTGVKTRSWFADRISEDPARVHAKGTTVRFRRQLSRTREQLASTVGLAIFLAIAASGAALGIRFSRRR